MAVVNITLSETLGGASIADTIAGGSTGIGYGNAQNGNYVPVVSKAANTGAKTIFISHNGANFIEQCGVYIAQFGVGTGASYGGGNTAAADFAQLIAAGVASQGSKNNADGLSGGLWMETRSNALDSEAFDRDTYAANVKTFGTLGVDLASYFLIPTESMVYNLPPKTLATTPVAGRIGPAGNTVLGDAAHLKFRFYVPNVFTGNGILQWDTAFTYAFTS